MSLELIANRRSVRHFKPDPISGEMIEELLEAACMAPSAGNMQPWFFYVIREKSLKKKLSRAALSQGMLVEAPVVIVVCAVPEQSAYRYGQRGAQLYCLQDTAAAVQNILLAATGLGLAACWVGAFNEGYSAAALEIPPTHRPVAMISLGYGKGGELQAPARKPLDQVSRWL